MRGSSLVTREKNRVVDDVPTEIPVIEAGCTILPGVIQPFNEIMERNNPLSTRNQIAQILEREQGRTAARPSTATAV